MCVPCVGTSVSWRLVSVSQPHSLLLTAATQPQFTPSGQNWWPLNNLLPFLISSTRPQRKTPFRLKAHLKILECFRLTLITSLWRREIWSTVDIWAPTTPPQFPHPLLCWQRHPALLQCHTPLLQWPSYRLPACYSQTNFIVWPHKRQNWNF